MAISAQQGVYVAKLTTQENPIVFMHTVWLRDYKGPEATMHAGGFKWPAANNWAGEIYNFLPIENKCYGYVELVHRRLGRRKIKPKIGLENLGARKGAESVSGVTVVWTAPNESGTGRKIVGWYENATVYKDVQFLEGKAAKRREGLGYRVEADAKNCTLLPPERRTLIIPRGGKGERGDLPGQATLYYPRNHNTPRAKQLFKRVLDFIDTGEFVPALRKRAGGVGRQPDIEKRKAVEAAAIACVKDHFRKRGFKIIDLQEYNVGYDLEALSGDERYLIEVKGCSGAVVSAEITPNEYRAMREEYSRKAPNGSYRLCIVTNALAARKHQRMHHYYYRGRAKKKHIWCNVGSDDTLEIKEVLGARVSLYE